MQILINRTDVLLLGSYYNAQIVGVYSAASKVAMLASLPLMAMNAIIAPDVARLFARRDIEGLCRLTSTATLWVTCASFLMASFLWLFAEDVLGALGDEFTVGADILRIHIAGQLVNAAMGCVGFLMTMTGHERQASAIMAMAALLNVVANYLLIPVYGATGAAWATAGSIALWNIVMTIAVYRNLGFAPFIVLSFFSPRRGAQAGEGT
jgi:O-antigen/teichoic acid export membrane protein